MTNLGMSQLARGWISARKSEVRARAAGLKLLSNRRSVKRRALILGSGELVTTVQNWSSDTLNSFEKIAVNFSYLAGVQSDVVLFEPTHSKTLNKLFVSHLEGCPLLADATVSINLRHWAQHRHTMDSHMIKDMSGHAVIMPFTRDMQDFRRWYNFVRFKVNIGTMIHHATHVFAAIDWALLRGFDEIVIAGVDLNGGRYFSDSGLTKSAYDGHLDQINRYAVERKKIEVDMGYKQNIHPSTDAEFSNRYAQLPAIEVFSVLSDLLYTTAKTQKIYVAHKDSALAALFPVWTPDP